jgi:hypothetical protein
LFLKVFQWFNRLPIAIRSGESIGDESLGPGNQGGFPVALQSQPAVPLLDSSGRNSLVGRVRIVLYPLILIPSL